MLPDRALVAKPFYGAAAFRLMLMGQAGGIALEGLLFFLFQSCNKSKRGDRKSDRTEFGCSERRLLSELVKGHGRQFTAPGLDFLNRKMRMRALTTQVFRDSVG